MKNVKMTCIRLFVAMAILSAAMTASAADDATATPMVNVNDATETELAFLPGVGPTSAKRIVAYRAKQPFKKPQHLLRVKGIGRKTFQKMKPFICVKGPTTAKKKIKSTSESNKGYSSEKK